MSAPSVDPLGRTALHYAALEGSSGDVQRCLALGADVAAQDRQGFTALHFACQQNRAEVVAALLDAGAPVDVADAWGDGPLFRAVFAARANPAIARQLVAAGADPDRENLSGVSPRALAQRLGVVDLAAYFGDDSP